VLVACAALAAGSALQAQSQGQGRPRNCIVDIDTAGRVYQLPAAGGGTLWYAGGIFKAHCRNEPTTMQSDSVEWYSERGELHLLFNVHFRDSTAILDADRVTYWTRQERLYAEGHVYTRNLASGSEMRGPNLDYLRAVPPIRDTIELYAVGRPTIRFMPGGDSAAADTTDPFVIVADRVRMKHTDRMWGGGHVTIDRSDLNARADSAMLDLADSIGYLIGSPQVTGHDTAAAGDDTAAVYHLTGRRIRFNLDSHQRIRHVLSSGDADAHGPDWRLTADTLDLALDSGKIERTQAWGRETRPVAVSGLSRIVADSLDIRMPGQVMELVWAWGSARSTSRPDSTVREDDWLSGDSLKAEFERSDSAGASRSDIRHITAFGSARAYYHTDNEHDPNGERGINYSRGDRIKIALSERKVRTVDIVGKVDGVYLEPAPPGADSAAGDSTAADSTRPRLVPADSSAARADSTVRRPAPEPAPGDSTTRRPAAEPAPARPASPRPRTPRSSAAALPGRRGLR